MNPFSSTFLALLCLLLTQNLWAQGYYGDADSLSCNCYRLTEAGQQFQGGFVWSNEKISLNEPFDYTFDVYLGEDIPGQPSGADGIAFVLQPVGTNAGSYGGSMGYGGITPSLAMSIDTYDNGNFDSDIPQDHVAIMSNGSTDHASADNLAGPEIALVSGFNIEDGEWHVMRVSWDPTTQLINFYMDGSLRVSYTGDIISDIFHGDPMVYWGFTGSTGMLTNLQQFCFSIIPGLSASDLSICEGETIDFSDNSYSALGDVVAWNWDFNNGQNSTLQAPGQIEFTQAGNYWVTQTIIDIQGCQASDSIEVVVSPTPTASFTATQVCEGEATEFENTTPQNTAIANWNFGDGNTGTGASVSNIFAAAGDYTIELAVTTTDGCTDTSTNTVSVFANPTAQAAYQVEGFDGTFTANIQPNETIEWLVNGNNAAQNPWTYAFPDSGWYEVTLTVLNDNGCFDIYQDSIYIEGIPDFQTANVFTPNGDGVNERFQPHTYAMTEASLRIYNRWGRSVFQYEGPITQAQQWGWDGTINGGAKAEAGTYYYILHLKGTDGNNYPAQGNVTLLP